MENCLTSDGYGTLMDGYGDWVSFLDAMQQVILFTSHTLLGKPDVRVGEDVAGGTGGRIKNENKQKIKTYILIFKGPFYYARLEPYK